MADLEERVTYLERRMDTSVGEVREQMDRRFEQLDGRIATLDQKVDARFLAFEQKVDARFLALELKVDHHFTWIVGIQVATLIAMIGTILGSLYMQRGG